MKTLDSNTLNPNRPEHPEPKIPFPWKPRETPDPETPEIQALNYRKPWDQILKMIFLQPTAKNAVGDYARHVHRARRPLHLSSPKVQRESTAENNMVRTASKKHRQGQATCNHKHAHQNNAIKGDCESSATPHTRPQTRIRVQTLETRRRTDTIKDRKCDLAKPQTNAPNALEVPAACRHRVKCGS